MKISRLIKVLLSALLAALLLYLAFKKVEWSIFWNGLCNTRWTYVLLSVLAAFIALILRSERWHSMLSPLDPGIKRISVWDSSNIGNIASVALPGVGEFVRCGGVCTKKAGYDKVFGTILLERVFDLLAIGVVLLAAILFQSETLKPFFIEKIAQPAEARLHLSLWWLMIIILAVCVAAITLIFKLRDRSKFLDRIAGLISGVFSGIKSFKDISHKWLFLLYTIGIWVMYILINFFTFKAIPELSELNFIDALFVSAAGNFASVVPTPGGFGAYHYLVALTLSVPFHASWETGILFATLTHESRTILLMIVALGSLLNGWKKPTGSTQPRP